LGRYEIKGVLSERNRDEKIKIYFDRRGGLEKIAINFVKLCPRYFLTFDGKSLYGFRA
jgi:hypothetical protein